MPREKSESKTNGNTTANIGFEAKLWLAADKLRSNMDAAEYKQPSPFKLARMAAIAKLVDG